MSKERVSVPRAVKDCVLREYNHRCAVCGTDRPQIHHIDEDPSNNDPLNLIPLCPNCHLIDQHNPTVPMDAGKLQLFRKFKDPTILKSQFHPLYTRLVALHDPDSLEFMVIVSRARELCDFIAALEMGAFYSKQVKELALPEYFVESIHASEGHREKEARIKRRLEHQEGYKAQVKANYDQVVALVIELLRFQKW